MAREGWGPVPIRLNRWLASWIIAMSEGQHVEAINVTDIGEKTRFLRSAAEEVISDPIGVHLFGPSSSFGSIVRLDGGRPNRTLGGYLFSCEHGVFHFLPGESLNALSPTEIDRRFRESVSRLLEREARQSKGESIYDNRGLVFIAGIALFVLGYYIGQAAG